LKGRSADGAGLFVQLVVAIHGPPFCFYLRQSPYVPGFLHISVADGLCNAVARSL